MCVGSSCVAIVVQLLMCVERGVRSLSLAIVDSRCDSAKVVAACVFKISKNCKISIRFLCLEARVVKRSSHNCS